MWSITTAWEWDKENRTFTVQNKFVADWMYGIDANDVVLMQFTGLYDRNGKEVWEGDIIKYTNTDGIKRVGFVEWLEEEACFYLNSLPVLEQTEKEVIGNIYQNPELLEEK